MTNDIVDSIMIKMAKEACKSRGIKFSLKKYRKGCEKITVDLLKSLSK